MGNENSICTNPPADENDQKAYNNNNVDVDYDDGDDVSLGTAPSDTDNDYDASSVDGGDTYSNIRNQHKSQNDVVRQLANLKVVSDSLGAVECLRHVLRDAQSVRELNRVEKLQEPQRSGAILHLYKSLSASQHKELNEWTATLAENHYAAKLYAEKQKAIKEKQALARQEQAERTSLQNTFETLQARKDRRRAERYAAAGKAKNLQAQLKADAYKKALKAAQNSRKFAQAELEQARRIQADKEAAEHKKKREYEEKFAAEQNQLKRDFQEHQKLKEKLDAAKQETQRAQQEADAKEEALNLQAEQLQELEALVAKMMRESAVPAKPSSALRKTQQEKELTERRLRGEAGTGEGIYDEKDNNDNNNNYDDDDDGAARGEGEGYEGGVRSATSSRKKKKRDGENKYQERRAQEEEEEEEEDDDKQQDNGPQDWKIYIRLKNVFGHAGAQDEERLGDPFNLIIGGFSNVNDASWERAHGNASRLEYKYELAVNSDPLQVQRNVSIPTPFPMRYFPNAGQNLKFHMYDKPDDDDQTPSRMGTLEISFDQLVNNPGQEVRVRPKCKSKFPKVKAALKQMKTTGWIKAERA